MRIGEIRFTVNKTDIATLKADMALLDTLHFAAKQDQPGVNLVGDVEIVSGSFVAGDYFHSCKNIVNKRGGTGPVFAKSYRWLIY